MEILLLLRMPRLLSNCKDVFSSKEVKKYDRRELLTYLEKVKEQLVIVERYMTGCRMALLTLRMVRQMPGMNSR